MTVRAMIVDDSEADQLLYRRAIENALTEGVEITSVSTIQHSLRLLDEQSFDLVLLDHGLPDGSGLDALKKMKERNLLSARAVIFSTGQGNESIAKQAIKLGAKDYLIKDEFDPAQFAHAVAAAFSQVEAERKLAQAEQELRSFSYMVAHDVKAPLRKIAVYSKMLAYRISEKLDAKELERLHTLERIAEDGVELVERLLEYTQAGEQIHAKKSVDLYRVVTQVAEYFSDIVQERGGSIVVGALPVVCGDAVRLRQLFQNLIGNGVKFCEQPPRIEVRMVPDTTDVCIEVRDNGIGVAKEHHEEIFQPLKRAHAGMHYEGAGLGLSICERIVKQHGGSICLRGGDPQGSVFVVTLPAHPR